MLITSRIRITRTVWAVVTLSGIAIWVICSLYVFPRFFAALYDIEWISQSLHLRRYQLEKYLAHWTNVWTRATSFLVAASIGIWCVATPRFRATIDRVFPIYHGDASPHRRIVLAHVAILVIIFGQGADILLSREHWPFSHYPMYTGIQSDAFDRIRVDGVKTDGTEFSLQEYFVPLSAGRISNIVSNHYGRDFSDHATRCARQYFDWYNAARIRHRHTGPLITAVRIYQLHWTMDDEASNVLTPDSKVLLAEYLRSQSSGN